MDDTISSRPVANAALEAAALAYTQTRSQADLERVVEAGAPLVRHYAAALARKAKPDDCIQAGYEGLLKAAGRYDPAREVLFATYASYWIIGEIRRELRREATFVLPGWLVDLQYRIKRKSDELRQESGSEPDLPELAAALNIAEAGIVEALTAGQVPFAEIDLRQIRSLSYRSFELPLEDRITLHRAVERLGDLPRKVISRIFYGGKTQAETAAELGLYQRRVSRILKRALRDLKQDIDQ